MARSTSYLDSRARPSRSEASPAVASAPWAFRSRSIAPSRSPAALFSSACFSRSAGTAEIGFFSSFFLPFSWAPAEKARSRVSTKTHRVMGRLPVRIEGPPFPWRDSSRTDPRLRAPPTSRSERLGWGMHTHFRTCHLCEAMCGIAIEVEGEKILSIRGDKDDPFSRGHVCPKAVALKDVHEDPDRLRRPLRRTATGWAEVGWGEALDEAAERLSAVQKAHGRNAVAIYNGNPVAHNHGSLIFGQLLARSLGSRSLYSATSVDQLLQMLTSLLMFGHQLLLPIPDIDRTDFLLILGANPLASNGSLMTAPGVEKRLKAVRARGGRVVVVDPRRTETAALADQHLPIRPAGDAFLLAAMLHVLLAEERLRPGKLAPFTDGLHLIADAVKPFTPESVAGRTGLE